MKEELLRLADRCEKATGPDRELDGAIHFAAILRQPCPSDIAEIVEATEKFDDSANWVARYTASLDAAITLVPEGWGAVVDWRTQPICASVETETVDNDTFEPEKAQSLCSATPALALCAASLRARASVKEQNNGK